MFNGHLRHQLHTPSHKSSFLRRTVALPPTPLTVNGEDGSNPNQAQDLHLESSTPMTKYVHGRDGRAYDSHQVDVQLLISEFYVNVLRLRNFTLAKTSLSSQVTWTVQGKRFAQREKLRRLELNLHLEDASNEIERLAFPP